MKAIEKINALLLQQGKTGAEMSRDLGLSNSAYSLWNTGSTNPSKKNLKRIADYFGVNVTDVVDDLEPGKEKPATISDGQEKNEEELLDIELMHRLTMLSPDELSRVDAFVQGILASR